MNVKKQMKKSRSPHGERGLKSVPAIYGTIEHGRSPHGERGLKFDEEVVYQSTIESLSSRRAWIEIGTKILTVWQRKRRSPHGERGLKSC